MNAGSERVVGQLFRRKREKLTVALRAQDGALRCHVRLFVMASAGRWRPTRHGISLEPGRLDELIAALRLAQAEATKADGNGRRDAA